jgi:predicted ester cyclase
MQEKPEAMLRRWFDELWNQGREDTIDQLLAPEAKVYGLPTPDNRPIGPDEFKPFFRQFRQAFPDIRITVLHTVAEGDFVAAHCHVVGTHLGNGLGVPPTSRAVEFSGMCIVRAAGDQFVEGWNCFDFLTCYQQIGLMPQLNA